MERRRIFVFGLIGLAVVFLIFGAMNHQRDAYMEGFVMGQLAASSDSSGINPLLLTQMGYGAHRGPGIGGLFFGFLGLGFLFLMVTRFGHMARYRAWAMHGSHSGDHGRGEGHHGPPWARHHHGCDHNESTEQPAAAETGPTETPQT